MSYAQSIDSINIEVTTGKVAQSIDSLDMLLSTSEGAVQDGIVLISPANGDINVSVTPDFDWSSSTAHDAYKILIDADETFSSPIEAYVTATDYTQTTALLSATGYFWKVIGGDVTDRPAIVPILGKKDSSQGDFEALQAFYNKTQGDGIPVLANESELPAVADAVYPYLYMIGGDIYRIGYNKVNEPQQWYNEGKPWLVKTGWDTMTVETMGDAVGVTVDANNRVTRVDMQKITAFSKSGGYLTAGNNLIGQLVPELGNLKKCEYFNIKQNFFYGSLPPEMRGMTMCKNWALAGFSGEFDITDRTAWYESNHTFLIQQAPELVRTTGFGADWTSGKRKATSNTFRTELPSEWGDINIETFEFIWQQTQGVLPESWGNKTSMKGILLNSLWKGNYPNKINSVIPQSWGNWQGIDTFYMPGNRDVPPLFGELPAGMSTWNSLHRLTLSSNAFYGKFPILPDIGAIYYFNIANNGFGGDENGDPLPSPDNEFPWNSILNSSALQEKNNTLNKFSIDQNLFGGVIPETNNDVSSFCPNGAIYINRNNFQSPMPNWLSQIRPQILSFHDNPFNSDMPAGFHDPDAPLYNNLRYIRGYNCGLTGSPPKVNFKNPTLKGSVVGNVASNEIDTTLDTSVLATGTITDADSGGAWIRDSNANWSDPWTSHEITIIVPDGPDIVGYSDESTNFENGYFYVRGTADVTGTVNLTYEIRNRLVGLNVAVHSESECYSGLITSANNGKVVVDFSFDNTVSGYSVWVYNESSNLLYILLSQNNFDSGVPPQWGGIRTSRADFFVNVSSNKMKGRLDPKLKNMLQIDNLDIRSNDFTTDDLADIVDAGFPRLNFDPQTKIGNPINIQFSANETIVLDQYLTQFDHPNNTYEWFEDDVSIGNTSTAQLSVTTNTNDSRRVFRLEVTNSLITNFKSVTEDISVEYFDDTQQQ